MRKLTKRETLLLKLLAVIAIVAVIFTVLTGVFSSSGNSGQNTSKKSDDDIDVLLRINSEYSLLKNEINMYNNVLNNQNDILNSQIQSFAESLNIAKNIEYTKRTQTNLQNKYVKVNIDIKINGADIQSILQFVSKIEDKDKLVFVTYVNIRKGIKEKELYDSLIKISTFSKNR